MVRQLDRGGQRNGPILVHATALRSITKHNETGHCHAFHMPSLLQQTAWFRTPHASTAPQQLTCTALYGMVAARRTT